MVKFGASTRSGFSGAMDITVDMKALSASFYAGLILHACHFFGSYPFHRESLYLHKYIYIYTENFHVQIITRKNISRDSPYMYAVVCSYSVIT